MILQNHLILQINTTFWYISVNTKVEVRFNIQSASWIPEFAKPKLLVQVRPCITMITVLLLLSNVQYVVGMVTICRREDVLPRAECWLSGQIGRVVRCWTKPTVWSVSEKWFGRRASNRQSRRQPIYSYITPGKLYPKSADLRLRHARQAKS